MTISRKVEKGSKAEEDSIDQAMSILRMPGSFLRQTTSEKFPYEAVLPGDWTNFRSRGLKIEAFKILMSREKLSMVRGHTDRWTLDGVLQ